MTAGEVKKLLSELHACQDAQEWANGKSLAEIWQQCERGDWLLWLCGRMADKEGWPHRQQVVLAACACARTALRFVKEGEKRPLRVIETAEKWARGKATIKEVRSAGAYAAAYAAYAAAAIGAGASAAYAAYAAYAAAAIGAGAYAAAYAAYAAAYAADAAYDAAYAADEDDAAATRKNTLKECADIVRRELHFAAIEQTEVTA